MHSAISRRKLTSFTAFQQSVAEGEAPAEGRGSPRNLQTFAQERRKFLLEYPEIKKLEKRE